jgi:hypothetical protein
MGEPPPSGVVFTCRYVPALGVGLVTKMFCFERGRLALYDRRDIAALRQHPWYGTHIGEAAAPPPPEKQCAWCAKSLRRTSQPIRYCGALCRKRAQRARERRAREWANWEEDKGTRPQIVFVREDDAFAPPEA